MIMDQNFKYFAFISFSSRDTEWGKRLQKKLEHFRLPTAIRKKYGFGRYPFKPVFFAPTDIQPGGLTEELQERLKASRNLIVICSPNSSHSQWVGKEIEFFHKLGRTKQIYFFIVDGQPHSENTDLECFNPIVDKLGLPEILGANIHEKNYRWSWMNKERAYIQLISKLLGIEFDSIWQRHKRLLFQKMIAWFIGGLAILVLWTVSIKAVIPFTADVRIIEASTINEELPSYSGGIMTMYLGNEILSDTVCSEKRKSVFSGIPQKNYDDTVRVTFTHPDFISIDTMLVLREVSQLIIRRNPDVYGKIHFGIWDPEKEMLVPNCKIIISDKSNLKPNGSFAYTVTSNSEGFVDIDIPINNQRRTYTLESDYELDLPVIYMPCGDNDVVVIKRR